MRTRRRLTRTHQQAAFALRHLRMGADVVPRGQAVGRTARQVLTRAAISAALEAGDRASVRSRASLWSVFSYRSLASAFSAWSALSVGSAGSFASAGSILSIGSAGSILSVGSAGSILSVGSSGSVLCAGGSGAAPSADRHPLAGAPGEGAVRHLSGIVAMAALASAVHSRSA